MLSRGTLAEISLSSYRHNLRYFIERVYPSHVMAVVKADAYGHGALRISEAAMNAGVDYLAVAFIEEALELRKSGIDAPILVFNHIGREYLHSALSEDISVTVSSHEQLDYWGALLSDLRGLKIHLKVDTGMKRLGVRPEEVSRTARSIVRMGAILEGVYSHLSCADERDESFSLKQKDAFDSVLDELDSAGLLPEQRHLCNSAGSFRFNSDRYSHVRLGIASFGLQPSAEVFDSNLEPVLRWKTVISMVKDIYPGERVSYGGTFVSKRTMRVATIPVGYADGYNRLLSNCGEVLISGSRCRILGRVCMDQFIVDVTGLQDDPEIGDEVVLLGKQGAESITAEEIASRIGTINYEVTCSISRRVPRVLI
ncbi:MAG TPA: alanine racemase [Kosmotogaceae bacterium]|nr:alanine racemase [Kosmotogaceae bacterium]